MQPICEPVELPPGIVAMADRVHAEGGAPTIAQLMHAHAALEIVAFGHVAGSFVGNGTRYALHPGTIALVPSMMFHDFELEPAPCDWTVVHVDAAAARDMAAKSGRDLPVEPICIAPQGPDAERIRMLSDWLVDLHDKPDNGVSAQVAGLMIAQLCSMPATAGDEKVGAAGHLARFRPVIDRLRARPGAPFSLCEAAGLCGLSPAYFSRRFTSVFGCGFADYLTSYRLHLAARRIARTALPLAEIGTALGFSSHSHFTARFRERFGVTPRDYRKSVRDSA